MNDEEGVGAIMRQTRTGLVEAEINEIYKEFNWRFGLRDGDYIKFHSSRGKETIGRIMEIEDCYYNQAGGFTANVKVTPLMEKGRLGNSRRVCLVCDANRQIRTLRPREPVTRVDVDGIPLKDYV